MNPLYLHSEGYEPEKEVQVNTILGNVFHPEENTEAKPKNLDHYHDFISDRISNY